MSCICRCRDPGSNANRVKVPPVLAGQTEDRLFYPGFL